MTDYRNIPDYDNLPPVKGMPKGCAWGVFDKDGKKDKFGTLNLITPEIVKEAVKEVKEGVSVSLKYGPPSPSSLLPFAQLQLTGLANGAVFAQLAHWQHQGARFRTQRPRTQGDRFHGHAVQAPRL
jgi:hypothetical protein